MQYQLFCTSLPTCSISDLDGALQKLEFIVSFSAHFLALLMKLAATVSAMIAHLVLRIPIDWEVDCFTEALLFYTSFEFVNLFL